MGIKFGRRYQDFQDLMLARRVAKIVDQRDRFAKEQQEYEKWERQDERIRKVNDNLREELNS
ncbi:hypothetical protein [Burkholderia ubonensis]|uniref:hypothetical protein n=1 Tax=Burkholderia ubonensis TaxID=101571 RepID=UPI0012F967EC|nr:hypothetical protein [Burkholderia ubonensis]